MLAVAWAMISSNQEPDGLIYRHLEEPKLIHLPHLNQDPLLAVMDTVAHQTAYTPRVDLHTGTLTRAHSDHQKDNGQ